MIFKTKVNPNFQLLLLTRQVLKYAIVLTELTLELGFKPNNITALVKIAI